MAGGVNKVILIGNLGSDPEIRHLNTGSVVANFNIATSESYTNKNGERVTQTEWHRIELWDQLAKIAEQYLKKGDSVYIEGKLKTDSWQDQDGVSRSVTRVRGVNLTMLGSPTRQNTGGQNPSPPPPMASNDVPPTSSPSVPPNLQTDDDEDDLPF